MATFQIGYREISLHVCEVTASSFVEAMEKFDQEEYVYMCPIDGGQEQREIETIDGVDAVARWEMYKEGVYGREDNS